MFHRGPVVESATNTSRLAPDWQFLITQLHFCKPPLAQNGRLVVPPSRHGKSAPLGQEPTTNICHRYTMLCLSLSVPAAAWFLKEIPNTQYLGILARMSALLHVYTLCVTPY